MPENRLWFLYQVPDANLLAAVGDVRPAVINISSDSEFEWVYTTIVVKQNALIVANWGGTMMIEDNSPGRVLMNAPIPVDALRGNGQQPYPLAPPRILKANSTLTFTFTNIVATATTVVTTLHGNKIFGAH